MNREEFFRELRSRLAGLPVDDLEDRLAFRPNDGRQGMV